MTTTKQMTVEEAKRIHALVFAAKEPDRGLDHALFDAAAGGLFWPEYRELWEAVNWSSRQPKSFTSDVGAAVAFAFFVVPDSIPDVLVGAGEALRYTAKDRQSMLPLTILENALDRYLRQMAQPA